MKKGTIIIAALLLPVLVYSFGFTIAGDWQGYLEVQGTKLSIVFHITQNEDGTYTSTMDSPDQNAFDLPVAKTTLKADTLILDVTVAQGNYTGIIDKENNIINGTWSQSGYKLTLNLKPVEKKEGK
ncbi:hypothetical protein JXO52_09240 [bacterium]|nr:hypothetical protein [bacterium]